MTLRRLTNAIALACGLALLATAPTPARAQSFTNVNTPALVTLAAAGAGTVSSADQTNYTGHGANVGVYISAKTGTIDVVVKVQGKDPVSGQYYDLLASASLTGTGFTLLQVFPGAPATSNLSANAQLPLIWRVQVISGTGTTPAVTMTVGASVIM